VPYPYRPGAPQVPGLWGETHGVGQGVPKGGTGQTES